MHLLLMLERPWLLSAQQTHRVTLEKQKQKRKQPVSTSCTVRSFDCASWCVAGSSDVTTTTVQAATTASRRLLQSGSTQNIGVNLNLPAGTNTSDVVALLTAASANNGTGTLLTAAQQACVSIHMFLYSILLAPSVVACVGLFHIPCPRPIVCCYKSMKSTQNDISLSNCCHLVCIPILSVSGVCMLCSTCCRQL